MRIACVLITHLQAKVELRRHTYLRDKTAVIVDRSRSRPLVVDYLPATLGVRAGMSLKQALSRLRDAVVLEADEPSYRRVFHGILAALQRVSDRVEEADLGIAYVGMDGLEELHGGEARLVNALLNCVPRDLAPRVGIARGKFPALVAARISPPMGVSKVPQDAAAFLAPHSISLLPIAPTVKADLHLLGLHAMGEVVAMSQASLADRFGHEGKSAWDLSRGVDDSPLAPLKGEEPVVERIPLPTSSTSLDLLLAAMDTLLKRAYSRPRMRGRYAGRAAFECLLSRPPPWEKEVHFKQEVGDWERASAIVRGRLEEDHPQAPVEEVTLTLSDITGESGVQRGLFHDLREDRGGRLLEAERRLIPRMDGKHALYRVVNVAPWHPAPEMRAFQVPLDSSGGDAIRPLSLPTLVEVREGPGHQPESVRLRKHWRRVARVQDTWSFDLWWMPTPMTRAYYRVSLEEGIQTTLFRDLGDGHWYRQGL